MSRSARYLGQKNLTVSQSADSARLRRADEDDQALIPVPKRAGVGLAMSSATSPIILKS